MRHSSEIDMCSGPLAGSLLRFSIPLMASSILQLLSIYTSDQTVIPYGLDRIHVICLTYLLCGLMDVTCGVVRGMGAAVTPTLVSLTGACGLRVVWIYTVFASAHSLFVLYLSYPVTWVVTCAAHLVCFAFFYRRLCLSGQATLHG